MDLSFKAVNDEWSAVKLMQRHPCSSSRIRILRLHPTYLASETVRKPSRSRPIILHAAVLPGSSPARIPDRLACRVRYLLHSVTLNTQQYSKDALQFATLVDEMPVQRPVKDQRDDRSISHYCTVRVSRVSSLDPCRNSHV